MDRRNLAPYLVLACAIVAGVSGPATPLVLDDCGHAPHMDFPALLLDLTSCFVNRVRVFG